MRAAFLGSLLTALAVIAALGFAAAADKPRPAPPACWQPAIIDGRHVQPRPTTDPCPDQAAHSRAESQSTDDADDAFIRDIIKRYQDFHIEEH